MNSNLRRTASVTGILGFAAVVAIVLIGCGGVNPFLSTQFLMNSSLTSKLGPGAATTPTTQPDNSTSLTSVCDLPAGQSRTLQVTIENFSTQFVTFAMTFIASSGTGGFVCDAELPNYQNAGYTYLGTSNTAVIGCDTVLLTGTRLLSKQFGINQGTTGTLGPATVNGTTVTPTSLSLKGISGTVFIPLPQLIVFGTADPAFICVGSDLCTQKGYVYTTSAGVTVGKSIEASRIQGSVCNTGFGVAPEWRLDTVLGTHSVQPFQYVFGGSIVVSVLDRSTDAVSNTRNQAVWLVTDVTGATLHNPNP